MRVYSIKPDCADVPGHLTLSVNVAGCSGGCRYCFSKELWNARSGTLGLDDVKEAVRENALMTEYVCWTGGDALAQNLWDGLKFVRREGLLNGLHATPIHPDRLAEYLDAGLLDWVHLSLYTSDARPHMRNEDLVRRSLDVLVRSGVPYAVNVTTTSATEHEVSDLRRLVAAYTMSPLEVTRALNPAWLEGAYE